MLFRSPDSLFDPHLNLAAFQTKDNGYALADDEEVSMAYKWSTIIELDSLCPCRIMTP